MRREEALQWIDSINAMVHREIRIMEVCGTHTQAIAKGGFSAVLDPRIQLISGPGCPVCVTPEAYMDAVIELLQKPNVIIASFGDMLRVKGSSKSLEDCMERKERIRVVYSPFAALDIAEANANAEVVFLAVGFETTAPLIAAAVKLARQKGIRNLSFLLGLKRMPQVLDKVLSEESCRLNALICPGHVSVVMGAEYFSFISERYKMPAAICGFEYSDVAAAIRFLVSSVQKGEIALKNLYTECVRPYGNLKARELLEEVFASREGSWRGIGTIADSAFAFGTRYEWADAEKRHDIRILDKSIPSSCQCGEVITGRISPFGCRMFAKACTPEEPKGPCMVSSEGSCAIYYKYRRSEGNG